LKEFLELHNLIPFPSAERLVLHLELKIILLMTKKSAI